MPITKVYSPEELEEIKRNMVIRDAPILMDEGEADTRNTQTTESADFDKRTALDTVGAGVLRDIDQTQGSLWAAGGLVADAVGADGARDYMFGKYQENMKEAQANPAEIGTYKNVDSWGDAGTYALETLGENAATIASFFMGGWLGKLAGRALSGRVSQQVAEGFLKKQIEKQAARGLVGEEAKRAALENMGRIAGAFATSSTLESGSMYGEEAEKYGIDNASPLSAAALGTLSGASDLVLGGEGMILSKFAKGFGKSAAEKAEKAIGREILKGIAREGLQEDLQELLAITHVAANHEDARQNLISQENADRLIDAGLKGGIGGAGFGAVGHGVDKVNESIERSRLRGQAEQEAAKLRDVDAKIVQGEEDQLLSQWQKEYDAQDQAKAAAEDAEMRRMSGEDIVSILTQRQGQVQDQQNKAELDATLDGIDQQYLAQPITDNFRRKTQAEYEHLVKSRDELMDRANTLTGPERQRAIASIEGINKSLSTYEPILRGLARVQNGEPVTRALQAGRGVQPTAQQSTQPSTQQPTQPEGQQPAPAQGLGTTPFTQNLGVGLSPIKQMPSDNAMQAEWEQREVDRGNENLNREWQARQAQQAARVDASQVRDQQAALDRDWNNRASEVQVRNEESQLNQEWQQREAQPKQPQDMGETTLMQKINDKIKRKKAGLNVNSPLTADDIDTAIQAVRNSNVEQELDMKEWLKALEEAKEKSPSEYMKEWLSTLSSVKQQMEERGEMTTTEQMKWANTVDEASVQVGNERLDKQWNSRVDERNVASETRALDNRWNDTVTERDTNAQANVAKAEREVLEDRAAQEGWRGDTWKKLRAMRQSAPGYGAVEGVEDTASQKPSKTLKERVKAKSTKKTATQEKANSEPNTAIVEPSVAEPVKQLDETKQQETKQEAPKPKPKTAVKPNELTDEQKRDKYIKLKAIAQTDWPAAEGLATMFRKGLINEQEGAAIYDWALDSKAKGKTVADLLAEAGIDPKSVIKPVEKKSTAKAEPKVDRDVEDATNIILNVAKKKDGANKAVSPEARKALLIKARKKANSAMAGEAELNSRADEDANTDGEAFSLTEEAKKIFGEKAEIEELESGSIIAKLPNGSAILIRQSDVLVAEDDGGKVWGKWKSAKVVEDQYGVKITRGGVMELAKDRKPTTGFHETFHAAMRLALSPTEIKLLEKKAEFQTDGVFDEEKAARAYEKWNPTEEEGSRFFKAIRATWKGIARFFNPDYGKTPDDVFGRIRSGKAWKNIHNEASSRENSDSETSELNEAETLYSRAIDEIYEKLDAGTKESIGKIMGKRNVGFLNESQRVVSNMLNGDVSDFKSYNDAFFAKFRAEALDGYNRIEVLGKIHDTKIKPGSKTGVTAYKTTRLATSIDSMLAAFLQHGPIKWVNGVGKIETKDKGFLPMMHELGEDMWPWLWDRVAMRAKELKAKGKENLLTDIDIERISKLTGPKRKANSAVWARADKRYQDLQKSILDFAIASGTISQEAADAFHSYNYIPFYRIMEDVFGNQSEQVGFLSGDQIQSGIKKLKGGKENLGDPLTNIVKNWSILITQAVRNNARTATIDMAKDFGDGVVVEAVSHTMKMKKGVLNIMRNGKDEYYLIKDEPLYNALADSDRFSNPAGIMKVANLAKRGLTFGATFTPAFRIRNFIRDTIQTVTWYDGYTFKDAYKGLKMALTEHPDYIALKAAGGSFSAGYLRGSDAVNVHKYIEEVVLEGKGAKGKKRDIHWLLAKWQEWGDAAENANRVALYSKLKAQGKSDIEAAYEAKDLLDFSMRGGSRSLAMLTSTVPFLNARIAGLYKMRRMMFNEGITDPRPELFRMAAMLTSTSLGLMAYNMTVNKDKWDELPEHERWNYWHWWGMGTHVRIPKPFEVGALFGSLPEVMAEATFGKEDAKYLWDFLSFTANTTLAFNPTPQLVKPLVDQWANKDSFTGQDIVPFGMEHLAPTEQYKSTTSDAIKAFCNMVEAIDGDMAPDIIKSPARFETLLRGYFSSLGMGIVSGVDVAARITGLAPSKPISTNDIPILGALTRDDDIASSRYVQKFYDMAAEMDEVVYTANSYLRGGETGKYKDYILENIDKLKGKTVVNKVRKGLSEIRTKRMIVERSRTMTDDQKRKALETLTEQRNTLAKSAYLAFGRRE